LGIDNITLDISASDKSPSEIKDKFFECRERLLKSSNDYTQLQINRMKLDMLDSNKHFTGFSDPD
jgi:hypothetical protein